MKSAGLPHTNIKRARGLRKFQASKELGVCAFEEFIRGIVVDSAPQDDIYYEAVGTLRSLSHSSSN
jgi:hypothetical protein